MKTANGKSHSFIGSSHTFPINVITLNAIIITVSENDEVPVTTRGRSSGLKRSKIRQKITEDNKSEKVIR